MITPMTSDDFVPMGSKIAIFKFAGQLIGVIGPQPDTKIKESLIFVIISLGLFLGVKTYPFKRLFYLPNKSKILRIQCDFKNLWPKYWQGINCDGNYNRVLFQLRSFFSCFLVKVFKGL